MTISTTANIGASIIWSQIDQAGLVTTSDIGEISSNLNLVNGTGLRACDAIWHDIFTLPSGSGRNLRLDTLTKVIFNEETTLGFDNVKSLIVKNNSQQVSQILSVWATGTDAFDEPFNDGSGNLDVHPQCALPLQNYISGWTVSPTHRAITIYNPGPSSINVEVAVIGVSGI